MMSGVWGTNFGRKWLFAGISLLLVAVGAMVAPVIASGRYGVIGRLVGGLVLISLCIATLREWRIGVVAFFVWVNFEDLARKFLTNDMTLYFVKDILVVTSYVGCFYKERARARDIPRWVTLPLMVWFGWALLEVANPDCPSLLVSGLGIRMTFFYVPLLVLGYRFFLNERQFRGFLVLMLTIAALVSILGIVQSFFGLSFLNPEAAPFLRLDLVRGESGMEVPRPTSTFADSSRFGHYLFVMIYLGLGFLGYLYSSREPKRKLIRTWTWMCWICVLAGLYVCGVRATILWFTLSLPWLVLAYTYARRRRRKPGRSLPMARIVLLGAAGLLVLCLIFPERFNAALHYYSNTLAPTGSQTEYGERSLSEFTQLNDAFSSAPLLGHGTGTASLGLQYLMGKYVRLDRHTDPYHVESGYASVVWEWGSVGLVLWLWWSIALTWKIVQSAKALMPTPFYWQAVTFCLYAFFLLFAWFFLGMGVYQDFITQAFLWFLAGFMFRAAGVAQAARSLEIPPGPPKAVTQILIKY